MRILYITQWFDPEPAFKGRDFAEALVERACEVRVITGFPNYPSGRIYPGYRLRIFQREKFDELVVDRVLLYPSHSRSAVGRAFNYLSFACSALIHGLITSKDRDVVYVYHPPLTAALAAIAIGAIRRIPVVVDIQDLWPDTLRATGMVRGVRTLAYVNWLCKFVYRRAARIVVQSHGMQAALIERGVPREKIAVILNWAQEEYAKPRGTVDLAPYGLRGRFNVAFAGNLGLAQALDSVLDAAIIAYEQDPSVQVILLGNGVEERRLRERVGRENLKNVRIMPHVAREEVADVLSACDALLVSVTDDPLFEITIPSKTQFYLCLGKPVLMAAKGDAARIIEQAQCGVTIPPQSPLALAQAILSLSRLAPAERAAMGKRGHDFYLEELSFATGITKTMVALNPPSSRS